MATYEGRLPSRQIQCHVKQCRKTPNGNRFESIRYFSKKRLERVKGIEPSSQPWEGHILPLNHTRLDGDGYLRWLVGRGQVDLFWV